MSNFLIHKFYSTFTRLGFPRRILSPTYESFIRIQYQRIEPISMIEKYSNFSIINRKANSRINFAGANSLISSSQRQSIFYSHYPVHSTYNPLTHNFPRAHPFSIRRHAHREMLKIVANYSGKNRKRHRR